MVHIIWTATIFRILAVWLACDVLIRVPGTLAGLVNMSEIEAAPSLSHLLLPAVVAWITSIAIIVVIWVRSERLAELVWGQRTPDAVPALTAVDPAIVQQAVFVGFGVYLVVDGVPNLAELAAGYYTLPTGFGLDTSYAGRMWARAVGVGIQMMVGAGLIVGSAKAARWLARVSPRDLESRPDA